MRFVLKLIPQLITAGLLVVVGMFAQYRYDLLQKTGSLLIQQTTVGNTTGSRPVDAVSPSSIDMDTFWEAWSYVQADYLDPAKLDPQTMVDGATAGMVSALGDPYTMYLPPEDNKRSSEDLAGAFFGVGIELGYKNEVLAVVSPVVGSPAEKAGIQPGDLILRVADDTNPKGEDSSKWSLNKAVDSIRGPKGSTVTLTLFRESNGAEPFEVALVRDEIVVKSVKLEFVESQGRTFAHVSVSRFGERTKAEWDDAVTQILTKKPVIAGIVLDLRNDPGGFFDGAIQIASDFIPSGVIVSQKGKYTSQDFNSLGTGRLAKIKTEVLVNGGSASASEIVAGALRDRIGSKLIGSKTFGKGTVQDRRELSNGGGLHVTIARWLLPGGDWIHDEGIPVDIEVTVDPKATTDQVLERALKEF
ncbi:S41 family peptidase [Candidatus Woesebacteria bacterium]|nr:S41 family peptidase [Candidatus Woesebacteria bacterium]